MAIFIVDASAALAWCFDDEAGNWTDELLERLRQGDEIVVPAHWPTEVLNGLLVASRRKRIKPNQPLLFWTNLRACPLKRSLRSLTPKQKQSWPLARSTASQCMMRRTWSSRSAAGYR